MRVYFAKPHPLGDLQSAGPWRSFGFRFGINKNIVWCGQPGCMKLERPSESLCNPDGYQDPDHREDPDHRGENYFNSPSYEILYDSGE